MRKSHALVLASAAVAVLGLGAFSAKSWETSPEIPESVRRAFPVIDWKNATKYQNGEDCEDVACWEPVQSKEACGKRCRCEWQEWEQECTCAKLLHVPMCQVYFPRPDISSLLLLATDNPGLRPTDRIVLLGDSITWLAGYQALLELAFHRLGLNVFVSNRGYNGGKTADVVFGNAEVSPVWLSVDAVLAEDQPTIVIILIGTNDVIVQRNADTVEEQTLMLVKKSQAAGATVIVSSLFAFGEQKPEFQERYDTINEHTAGLKRISAKTGATFTDLRADVLAYEAVHNTVTEKGLTWGILTSDQTHPCLTDTPPCNPFTHGNYLIANALARGLMQALRSRVS